jgi:hypothetical protein
MEKKETVVTKKGNGVSEKAAIGETSGTVKSPICAENSISSPLGDDTRGFRQLRHHECTLFSVGYIERKRRRVN